MKQSRRLIFYLALNFVVSACATLIVLLVWDQMGETLPRDLLPDAWLRLAATATPGSEVASQATPLPQPTPTETFIVHQVRAGETFESIAEQYGVSVGDVLASNGFTRAQALGAGEILRIPIRPESNVEIKSVVAYGDLENERVQLEQRGEKEISLAGWRLEDGSGQVYFFSQSTPLILYASGAVNIYTKSGVDSVVDLFWGLDQPVWYSGATVILRDGQDNVRDTYVVP